jgi:hypothetical protein
VGVLATIENDKMKLSGQLFTDQSTGPCEAEVKGIRDEGERLASHLLKLLRALA